ncbi:MAG: restriction endonuclease [Bacteroidetes bacterium]|nr:restriction endonuclease [Bacteroidota bacterium]
MISAASDLVTSRDQTRAGFISMALEKNYMAIPFIEEAKALRSIAARVKSPQELLAIQEIRFGLLTASGLSDKALGYLNAEDQTTAIEGLIEKFLEPAGPSFADELVYRFLLIKGDALGGKARNLAGALASRKLLRTLVSVLNLSGIHYKWKDSESVNWYDKKVDDVEIESRIASLYWQKEGADRMLLFNKSIPVVGKNVDLVLMAAKHTESLTGKTSILGENPRYLAFGELKGGIDPAGADEHWKTANKAFHRIRDAFTKQDLYPSLFFVGAAIEKSMADEIYQELNAGKLTGAANLTNDDQLVSLIQWLISI